MTTENKPHNINAGRGVRATIWSNEGKNGTWYNVKFSRCYKDDTGELQNSDSFTISDLLHVAWAATKAFEHIKQKDEK